MILVTGQIDDKLYKCVTKYYIILKKYNCICNRSVLLKQSASHTHVATRE
jgi:hypothetical protein